MRVDQRAIFRNKITGKLKTVTHIIHFIHSYDKFVRAEVREYND